MLDYTFFFVPPFFDVIIEENFLLRFLLQHPADVRYRHRRHPLNKQWIKKGEDSYRTEGISSELISKCDSGFRLSRLLDFNLFLSFFRCVFRYYVSLFRDRISTNIDSRKNIDNFPGKERFSRKMLRKICISKIFPILPFVFRFIYLSMNHFYIGYLWNII